MFTPSAYQKSVYEFIQKGVGNAIVSAVAGSGKTTTLIQGARLLSQYSTGIFLAFNKHIADELSVKLRGTPLGARTIHSVGMETVRQLSTTLKVSVNKYGELAEGSVPLTVPPDKRWSYVKTVVRLCDLARVNLTPLDTAALEGVCDRYSINGFDVSDLARSAQGVLQRGRDKHDVIDFTDMLWFPHEHNLFPRGGFDWVFADEVQDFSPAQLGLVLKINHQRMLSVGDPYQSIMGFAGASSDSYDRVRSETKAAEYPLSICYRCPQSHLVVARQLVPHIEAAPDAPDGILETLERGYIDRIRAGDMIISRTTAPLLQACIQLIGRQLPARVRGRDVSGMLHAALEKIEAYNGFTYERFAYWVGYYRDHEIARIQQRPHSATRIQQVEDVCDCLDVCWEGFPNITTVAGLKQAITGLFSDEESTVWLSTVHRAKGLEADRVFVLNYNKMPLTWEGQTEDEKQQERNVLYVALTRAKKELYLIP